MAIAVGLLLSASVPARDAQWYSAEGEPLPDTEARKFVDGFGAWLLTTANTHWSDHTAYAQRALALAVSEPVSVVVRGQVISVLIFVMNPAANGFDQTDVSCDVQVIRPDGTQERRHRLPCLARANFGGSQNLYRTDMMLEFEGEPADPPGTWTVLAEIKDHVRDTPVKLRTTVVR